MHIGIISQYYPPDVGGASMRVSSVAYGLRKRGHKITVVTAFPHYPLGSIPRQYKGRLISLEGDENLRLIRVWIPGLAHQGVARRIALYCSFCFSALLAGPFLGELDVIIAMSPNYICMAPATVFRSMTGGKIIHDVVDVWPEAMKATGFTVSRPVLFATEVLARISYILSDIIVTLSDSLGSSLRKVAPSSIPIVIVENSVDDSFFKIAPKERMHDWRIVYLGTLGPSNDFGTLIKAAKILKDDNDVRFTLEGPGEAASEIITRIRSIGTENVDLRAERIPHDQVPLRLSKADALILPLKAGFGNASFPSKLGEYLASGRPVICTTDGELGKVLSSRGVAIVVSPGDVSGLSDAVRRLKGDPDLSQKLGEKGREFAVQNFSRSAFEDKVSALVDYCQKVK